MSPVPGVAGQAGVRPFGGSVATSVLEVNWEARKLDHVHVVNTSFMSGIGAMNPALTGIADAIRIGEYLSERLG